MTSLTTVRLDSLGKIVTGSTPPAAHPEWFAASGIPFVTPSDLTDNQRRVRTQRFLSEMGAQEMANRLIPANAVCFVSIGSTIGKMCSTTSPSVTNQQINSLVVDESIADPTYVYYAISQISESLKAIAGGSATPILNKTTFASIELDVLPLPEQRAIAATLGALDDKIESNRRAIVSISDLLDAQSEKSGADLPTVPLGVIATSVKDTVNPSKLGDAVVDHFSLPAFDAGARPERVAAATIKSNKLKVPRSAVLLSRLNPRFNRTWWASAGAEASALASTEFLVLASEDDLELAAVWLAVRDPFFREELPKRVTGTSGSHQRVRPDDVLTIEVPDFRSAAPEAKQSTLALLMRVESLRVESDRLTALRNALLPELLSGRMRVPTEGAAA